MEDTLEKGPGTQVDGRENQGLTRVPASRMHGAQVIARVAELVDAPALGAGESNSAIGFFVEKNRIKSKRWVVSFKGDPTLFLFSGVICPTSVPPIA